MKLRVRLNLGAMALVSAICGISLPLSLADPVEYQLTVRNDWSQLHHKPGAPAFSSVEKPHFSHLGGGTHNSDLLVWELGGMSSSGMIKMQETGWIDEPGNQRDLKRDFDTYLASGSAGSFLNYPIPDPWFPAGTDTVLTFDIEATHPLVTLVSMLGPSPDWFIGVSSLNLRDGNRWKEIVEVDLFPYDGGSRSRDNQFALFGPAEDPQLPIRLITDDDDTLLLGSLPIGRFTFELLTPQPRLGDFDDSLSVGNGDLTLLLDSWGGAPAPEWVIDPPVSVGNASLTELLDNWGNSYASGVAAAVVPEPGSLMLLSAALLTLVGKRRSSNPSRKLRI